MANAYLHCMGCELLAKKDFNICVNCFQLDRWKINGIGRSDTGNSGPASVLLCVVLNVDVVQLTWGSPS
jgi:hypothetical protein